MRSPEPVENWRAGSEPFRQRQPDAFGASKHGDLGRFPLGWRWRVRGTHHRGVELAQGVAVRKDLINTVRGLVKSMGTRLPKCSTESFAKKVEGALPAEVRDALLPLVRLVEALSSSIKGYDERIEKLATEKYPHTKLLRQVKGVGPLTSLAYVLTLQDPQRFVNLGGHLKTGQLGSLQNRPVEAVI